jgi:hypothetical protein
MFDAPTLETLPAADDAKAVVSIRHAIVSWACGNGRRRVLAHTRRKRGRAVAAKVKAEAQKPAAPKGHAAAKNKALREKTSAIPE